MMASLAAFGTTSFKPEPRTMAVSVRQSRKRCIAAFFFAIFVDSIRLRRIAPSHLGGRDRWRGCRFFCCRHYVGQTFIAGHSEFCFLPRIRDPAMEHGHERKSEQVGDTC